MIKAAPPKRPRFLRILGIAALAVAVFLVSVWLLFPYAEVERRLVTELAKFGVDAEISGLGPRTPLSYRVKSIRIVRAMGKEVDLKITDAVIGVSLGPILDGRVGLSVDAGFMGGEVKADLTVPKPEKVDLSWNAVDMAQVAARFPEAEVEVKGRTSGEGTVTMPFEGLSRLDASISSTLSGVSVGPLRVMGFQIDPISLGSGRLKAESQKGRVRVYDTAFTGGDLGVTLDGNITLSAPMARSPMEAAVALKPSESAISQYSFAFSLLTQYKQVDGSYAMNIGGTPASPTVRAR